MRFVLVDTNVVSYLLKGDARAEDYAPFLQHFDFKSTTKHGRKAHLCFGISIFHCGTFDHNLLYNYRRLIDKLFRVSKLLLQLQ